MSLTYLNTCPLTYSLGATRGWTLWLNLVNDGNRSVTVYTEKRERLVKLGSHNAGESRMKDAPSGHQVRPPSPAAARPRRRRSLLIPDARPGRAGPGSAGYRRRGPTDRAAAAGRCSMMCGRRAISCTEPVTCSDNGLGGQLHQLTSHTSAQSTYRRHVRRFLPRNAHT